MYYLHIFLYLLTFTTFILCQVDPWLPKIVWTYWQDPLQQTDQLMVSFFNNHQEMLSGWEIRHLNKNNMWDWLSQIPGLKDIFLGEQFQNQDNAKRADLIRLAIMHHYGGVWIDYTMILVQNLDWVMDLKNNPLVRNKNGQHPDIFILFSSQHGDFDYHIIKQTNQKFMLYPTFQIFFMAAKPGNQFAKDWMEYYIKVVKNSYQKYKSDKQKSWLLDYAKQNDLKIGGFTETMQRYFECSIASSVLLQEKQKQLDKNWKSQQQPRQLAVKNYNIWVMGTAKTAYNLHWMANFQLKPIVNILLQTDIEYLKQKNYFPKYFLKIYHQIFFYLKLFFINASMEDKLECPQSYYIYDNSILYKYLLQHNAIKFYQNKVVDTSYNRNCIWPINSLQYKKYSALKAKIQEQKQQKMLQNEKRMVQLNKLLQKNQNKMFMKIKQIQDKNKKQLDQLHQKIQWQMKQQYKDKAAAFQQHINQLQQQILSHQKSKTQLLDYIRLLEGGSMACILSLVFVLYVYITKNRKYNQQDNKKYKKYNTDQAQTKKLFQTT